MYGEKEILALILGMENKSVQYKLFNSKVTHNYQCVDGAISLLGIVAAVPFMSKKICRTKSRRISYFKLTLKEVVPDKDIVSIQRHCSPNPMSRVCVCQQGCGSQGIETADGRRPDGVL